MTDHGGETRRLGKALIELCRSVGLGYDRDTMEWVSLDKVTSALDEFLHTLRSAIAPPLLVSEGVCPNCRDALSTTNGKLLVTSTSTSTGTSTVTSTTSNNPPTQTHTPTCSENAQEQVPSHSPPLSRRSDKQSAKRNDLFEAIARACGVDLESLTSSARGMLNKATKEISNAGGSAEEVPLRAAEYKNRYRLPLTPTALAKHWPTLTPRRTFDPRSGVEVV